MIVENDIGKLVELSVAHYAQYKEELVSLYLHAFTVGSHAQFISKEQATQTLQNLFQSARGLIFIHNHQPAGLLFWQSLFMDEDFPKDDNPDINPQSSAYIAEVLVHDHFRGRGIATLMIETALHRISKQFTYSVIRVWDENLPAVNLYRKLGFREIGKISQTKLRTPDEKFEMIKLYMAKKHDTHVAKQ